MRPFRVGLIAYCMGLLLTFAPHTVYAADLTVFAAASLKEAPDEADMDYTQCENLLRGQFYACQAN
jgi:ABC-type molybdate transport system substrate-binding protein